MTLASYNTRAPQLLRAIEALARRTNPDKAAQELAQELAGITVLVARKFTNDRTAEGLQQAQRLTTGCISLGLGLVDIAHDPETELAFLLNQGAEQVFQMGFRHIKQLAGLPSHTMRSDFDNVPQVQQREIKALFSQLCHAEPDMPWAGDEDYQRELTVRQENQLIVDCARWLRANHHTGAIRDTELDAYAVIAVAVIFAIGDDGRIVSRTGQKDIENLIRRVRTTVPDIEANCQTWLAKTPAKYQPLLRERMVEYRTTIIKKILSKTAIKTVVGEIQQGYAGIEQDVDYD